MVNTKFTSCHVVSFVVTASSSIECLQHDTSTTSFFEKIMLFESKFYSKQLNSGTGQQADDALRLNEDDH